ncbi:MAG TPA: hypothetical protein VGJ60_20220 [Chloroflexota bacterium]|jgi:hypothetical protein
MTRAYPEHRKHCSCPRIPADLFERMRANPRLSAHPDLWQEFHRVLTGSPFPNGASAQRSRILAKVSIPDAQGHQRWTGKRPQYGAVRAMFDGVTQPVVKWLYLWSGPDNIIDFNTPLRRVCRDTECISPLHHQYVAPSFTPSPSTRVAVWEQDHPRPKGRPTRWDRSDPTGERCLAGHGYPVFQVYPGGKRQRAYCKACNAAEKEWLEERRKLEREVERATHDYPRPAPNMPAARDPRAEAYWAAQAQPQPSDMHDPDWLAPQPGDPGYEPTLSDLLEAGELGA